MLFQSLHPSSQTNWTVTAPPPFKKGGSMFPGYPHPHPHFYCYHGDYYPVSRHQNPPPPPAQSRWKHGYQTPQPLDQTHVPPSSCRTQTISHTATHTATHHNAPQHTATHRNTPHRNTTHQQQHMTRGVIQRLLCWFPLTHCNTLQHTVK